MLRLTLLLALLLAGCQTSPQAPEKTATPKPKQAFSDTRCVTENVQRSYLQTLAWRHLVRQEYDALEKLAAETQGWVAGPHPAQAVLFDALATHPRDGYDAAEPLLREWVAARPQSQAARIALALALVKKGEVNTLVDGTAEFPDQADRVRLECALLDPSLQAPIPSNPENYPAWATRMLVHMQRREPQDLPHPEMAGICLALLSEHPAFFTVQDRGSINGRTIHDGLVEMRKKWPDSIWAANFRACLAAQFKAQNDLQALLDEIGPYVEVSAWYRNYDLYAKAGTPHGQPHDWPLPAVSPLPDLAAEAFFELQVRELFLAHRFDELEDLARQVKDERFPSGRTRLEEFYAGLLPQDPTDEEQRIATKTVEAWPASPTQAIARAAITGDPIPDYLKFDDPNAAIEMMEIQAREGKPFEEAFARALELDPQSLRAYGMAAHYSLPRWGGSQEKEQNLAESAARKLGEAGYAWVAYQSIHMIRDAWKDVHFDPKRLAAGFADLKKKYPSELQDARHLYTVCHFGQRAEAKKLFANAVYVPEVWYGLKRYRAWQKWALNPQAALPAD